MREVNAVFAVFGIETVQRQPRFFGGVNEDGCGDLDHGDGSIVHHGLCASSLRSIGLFAIEAIFGGRHIDGAHGVVGEEEEGFTNALELEVLVSGERFEDEFLEFVVCPEVDAMAICVGEGVAILVGIEVVEVGEQETDGIADLAVFFACDMEEFLVDFDIVGVVERTDPPAADIGSVFFE